MTMVGTEYRWMDLTGTGNWELALRGGYWYSQTPIPDSTFSPGIPDADNHAISVGMGVLCKQAGKVLGIQCGQGTGIKSKSVGLDLAYQAVLYETRTISGNMHPLAIPGVINGTYRTTYHVGSINFRVMF
jgi:long-chain fatty acid transport protein